MRYKRNRAKIFEGSEGTIKIKNSSLARKSGDSIDDQVDSLILMYEKDAIRSESQSISESLRKLSLSALLREQDEDAAMPMGDEGDMGGDAPADAPADDSQEPVGSEEMTAEPATTQKLPDLDIDKFTKDVARLTMNYKELLDIERAVINRTKNFLDKNYGDDYVQAFLRTLEEQFGVSAKEFGGNYDDIDAPHAIGANPAGAGSVGGS